MLLCCYHELSLDLIWLELQYDVLMVVCFVLISGYLCGLHGVLCVIKLCVWSYRCNMYNMDMGAHNMFMV